MRVLLRADASAAIGTGHVVRCLALAAGLRELLPDATVILASAGLPASLARRAREAGVALEALERPDDAAEVSAIAERAGADWLVVDGYAFDASYLDGVRAGRRLLVIDDAAALPRYAADLVLNQNAYAERAAYAGRATGARLLLGPRYALLGPAFAAYRDWRRRVPPVGSRVLVTLGGADPDNVTSRVMDALRHLGDDGLRVDVAIGGANPHAAAVERRAGADKRMTVHRDTADMPRLMAGVDLAIASAGTTAWELCFMALPALYAVLAENQVPVAAALRERGVGESLDAGMLADPAAAADRIGALLHDPERRGAMAAAGRTLVDGRGAERVARAMLAADLRLRSATAADAAFLFDLANELSVRAASFNPASIAWEEHVAWLKARLADPDSLLLIVEDRDRPVGQVRFDLRGDAAVASVALAPAARGKGYASAAIEAAGNRAFDRWPVTWLEAEVKAGNEASLAAFREAGYGEARPAGHDDALVLRRVRETEQLEEAR